MEFASLFSGSGAFDLGFENLGFNSVAAFDVSKAAVDTYNLNRDKKLAMELDLSDAPVDSIMASIPLSFASSNLKGIVGGPPCQYFSMGNRAKKNLRDPRRRLPFAYAKILKELNERYQLDFFIFENVAGLAKPAHAKDFDKLKCLLEKAGFNIFYKILNAHDFGVPQKRLRLFIVGWNKKKYPIANYEFPEGSVSNLTVSDAISGLPQPQIFERGLDPRKFPSHPNHWTMKPKSPKFFSNTSQTVKKNARSFRRLDWKLPSYTVAYGNNEIHVHPGGGRRLSIYEAMRLQGFPKRYVLGGHLSDQVRLVSDAVPPPLGKALARSIIDFSENVKLIYEKFSHESLVEFQRDLLLWFKENQRDFPWRTTKKPFYVLIAEKLLQQTAAGPKLEDAYKELTRRYPNPLALSKAKLQTLTNIVRPLGFTYRAGELKAIGNHLVKEYDSQVPRQFKFLMEIPGVGEYAAKAILLLAFNRRVAIVDTNVARLVYRLLGIPGALPSNPARNKKVRILAEQLLPLENYRDFNLAVLDFSAEICKAKKPKCSSCPIIQYCSYGKRTSRQL